MQQTRSTRRFTWVHAAGIAVVAALLVWAGIHLAPYFARKRIETFVRGTGAWGPLVVIALQIAQILLAPIPGVVVPLLAGVLYGPWIGPLITAVGSVLGSGVAHFIGRYAGTPLLRRWLGQEKVDSARRLVGGRRWLALVPLFLFPFSPSDAICFVAGMVGVEPGHFFLAVLLGRLPKDCAVALAGAGLIRVGGLISSAG